MSYPTEAVFDDGRTVYNADPRISFHQVEEYEPYDENGQKVDRYVSRDYIRIEVDKYSVLDKRATEEDKVKYPFQWMQYKGIEQTGRVGTKLSVLPGMTLDNIQVLNRHNILFIEELAAAPDFKLQQSMGMGGTEWKKRAEAYLSTNKQKLAQDERAHMLKAADEVAELKSKLEEQSKLIEKLLESTNKKSKKEAE